MYYPWNETCNYLQNANIYRLQSRAPHSHKKYFNYKHWLLALFTSQIKCVCVYTQCFSLKYSNTLLNWNWFPHDTASTVPSTFNVQNGVHCTQCSTFQFLIIMYKISVIVSTAGRPVPRCWQNMCSDESISYPPQKNL